MPVNGLGQLSLHELLNCAWADPAIPVESDKAASPEEFLSALEASGKVYLSEWMCEREGRVIQQYRLHDAEMGEALKSKAGKARWGAFRLDAVSSLDDVRRVSDLHRRPLNYVGQKYIDGCRRQP